MRGALVAQHAVGSRRHTQRSRAGAVHEVDMGIGAAVRVAPSLDAISWRPKDGHLEAAHRLAAAVHQVDFAGRLVHSAVNGRARLVGNVAHRTPVGGSTCAGVVLANQLAVAHVHMSL
jgi:hypothetical protein